MRIFRRIRPLGYLLFFAAFNMTLSFVLEPAYGASGMMWEEYYREDELDMIFVGSSVCNETFDPYIFNERLGVNSFNMGTPLQALPQSLRAVEEAIEDHDIETVIIAIGFQTLRYDALEEAELTFESARIRQMRGTDQAIETVKYLLSEGVANDKKSIQYMFPWIYNRIEISSEMLSLNIKAKVNKENTKGTSRKGYQNEREDVFDYNNRWLINSFQYSSVPFEENMMKSLGEILQLCKEQEIEVIVINTPHPIFDTVSCYRTYAADHLYVSEFCKKYDVDYYDFSLCKPELFELDNTYFSDCEHLTMEGAKVFCEQLSDFLLIRKEQKDMSFYFYTVDEFMNEHESLLHEWQDYQNW